jgi:hypothetical protein
MIRLLADENFPLASIEILEVKYDILSIAKLLIPQRGIFYFRLQQFQDTTPAQIVIDLLEKSNFDVSGTITVIEENFIRQKKF